MDKKLQNTDGNYLFNVDILINARTNPLALQYLLELLNNNSDKVTDFKINSGLELGRSIDTLLRSAKAALNQEPAKPAPFKMPVNADSTAADKTAKPAPAPAKPAPAKPAAAVPVDAFAKIRQYIKNNQLVRLRTNRPGNQVSMPCRILNFDEESSTISVYHVDEKQVYTFKIYEIDEFM
ncbi:hypothetical protein R70723_09935 [Paenibacillus sp. FSL R7-0273]|uniref:hypothetical protein n=1 Tax=Paenibacillus sp. FSL R7-0273 TaxID=1536772 RepID=UPI0004F5EC5C|nr:hypothetical protein [Paenibacillus sp. FSL R7-0273]AIQ46169.1 hypothetical protein R70723_09935 [Paenibacillus sp. FSL R7-0273]OMF84993.1 hypothetical protein BK144_29000 [Paenibacillus sp. FSL R7-0273]